MRITATAAIEDPNLPGPALPPPPPAPPPPPPPPPPRPPPRAPFSSGGKHDGVRAHEQRLQGGRHDSAEIHLRRCGRLPATYLGRSARRHGGFRPRDRRSGRARRDVGPLGAL